MKTYRPSGNVSAVGLVTFLGISLTAAIAIGSVAHFIGQWFYLIILFPIGMGFGASFAISMGISIGKCRNYGVAVAVALLTGAVLYGSMHYFDYMSFRKEAISYILAEDYADEAHYDETQYVESEDILEEDDLAEGEEAVGEEEEPVEMTGELAGQMIDFFLKMETGHGGFIGYLLTTATEGVSISSNGGSGANIGKVGTFIYWGIEFVAILFFAFLGAAKAKDPFCESCEVWFEDTPMTQTDVESAEGIVNSLKDEQFTAVVPQIKQTFEVPCVRLTGSICPTCTENDAIVKMEVVTLDEKGNEDTKNMHDQMVPMLAFKQIVDGIAALDVDEASPQIPSDVEAS